MDQNVKKTGLINWVALMGVTIGLFWVSYFVSSAAGYVGTALACLGFLAAVLSYFQMGLEQRESLERLEMEELSRSRGSASLFDNSDADTFPARRAREQFERYFVPGFTILFFLLQIGALWGFWYYKRKMVALATDPAKLELAMALLGLFGLVLFMLGKYASGLAHLQNQRLLRPSSSYALLVAYVSFLIAAGLGAVWAGFPKVDIILAYVLCVVLGVIALENLLGLIMEIYRVRVKGAEVRVLYESRLVGLLGKPEAILSTAAHALDYQFGFKVSETWFYRFLEKAFPLLVGAQVAILILSTCVIIINPGEQGLYERLGAPVTGHEVLNPGLHFKLPWPIDVVHRYATEQIQSFEVGSNDEEEESNEEASIPQKFRTIAWTKSHAKKEDNLLVASHDPSVMHITSTNNILGEPKSAPPVNLIAVGMPVQYQITNLMSWVYLNEDPETLLKETALRELVCYLASADLEDLMAHGRSAAGTILQKRIQKAANDQHLGVKIVFTALADIHPPVKVAKYYEDVIGAAQTKEATILAAQAMNFRTNGTARGLAFKNVKQAEAEKALIIANSIARVGVFTNQMKAYAAAPSVYAERAYLQVIAEAGIGPRKYVIATTNTSDIIQMNLEDKFQLNTTDVNLPSDNSKK